MGFTAAQYQATINEINATLAKVDSGLEHVRRVVNKQLERDPFLGPVLKHAFDKLVDLVSKGVQKIKTALVTSMVPMIMNEHEDSWLAIRKKADDASSELAGQTKYNDKSWKGIAGGAYHQGVGQQPAAVAAVATKAASVAAACTSIRNAGYTFYLGLAAALLALTVGLAGATTVFAPVAAAIAFVVAIGVALSGLLIQLSTAEKSLESASGAGTAFPGHHWPAATTS